MHMYHVFSYVATEGTADDVSVHSFGLSTLPWLNACRLQQLRLPRLLAGATALAGLAVRIPEVWPSQSELATCRTKELKNWYLTSDHELQH